MVEMIFSMMSSPFLTQLWSCDTKWSCLKLPTDQIFKHAYIIQYLHGLAKTWLLLWWDAVALDHDDNAQERILLTLLKCSRRPSACYLRAVISRYTGCCSVNTCRDNATLHRWDSWKTSDAVKIYTWTSELKKLYVSFFVELRLR